jgi:hypothetical protein
VDNVAQIWSEISAFVAQFLNAINKNILIPEVQAVWHWDLVSLAKSSQMRLRFGAF